MPAAFELRVMCWMEEEGDPRLAEEERTAGAPQMPFLLYLLPSARRRVPPSSRTSFQVPKPLRDYFLVKAPPGQAQVSLPSLYMVKHNLSFQDQLVWYQAASWVFQSLGEVKWYPLCTSTQDPAALVTGMRTFSRDLQPQDLMSESPTPYCWSVSVLT